MKPDLNSDNAYEILGVPHDASVSAIRTAFKKLAVKNHPDAVPGERKRKAAELFAKVNQAHEVLRNSEKRKNYDQLLSRGITPDLNLEVGGAEQFRSLADIIGSIQSLDIGCESRRGRIKTMTSELRNEMLLPSLINSDDWQESIIDLLEVSSIVITDHSKDYEDPEGELKEGWMVLTEIRIIFLGKWVHKETVGNQKSIKTQFRSKAFPYFSLKNQTIEENGRAYKEYAINVVDEDGPRCRAKFREPTLTSLLVVSNAYELPLKVTSTSDKTEEYQVAMFFGALPLVLWALPFAFLTLCANPCGYFLDESGDPFSFFKGYQTVYEFMTYYGLSTAAFYVAPLVWVWQFAAVYLAWNTGMSNSIVRYLAHDFAKGTQEFSGEGDNESGAPDERKHRPVDNISDEPEIILAELVSTPKPESRVPERTRKDVQDAPKKVEPKAEPNPAKVAMPSSVLAARKSKDKQAPKTPSDTADPTSTTDPPRDDTSHAKNEPYKCLCPFCGEIAFSKKNVVEFVTCKVCERQFEFVPRKF